MKNYYINNSEIHGKGTFSNKDLNPNKVIGIALIKVKDVGIPAEDYIRTTLGRYINHSKRGNTELVESGNYIALQTIEPVSKGKELLLDYDNGIAYRISGGFKENDLNKY